MSNDKKVEVVKFKTTVSFNWYYANYGEPKEIEISNSVDKCRFVSRLSDTQSLIQNVETKSYAVVSNSSINVKVEAVLYEAIKDYAMYQPELEFKDDEFI